METEVLASVTDWLQAVGTLVAAIGTVGTLSYAVVTARRTQDQLRRSQAEQVTGTTGSLQRSPHPLLCRVVAER